jgi:FkbM family methyltransferase
MNVEEYSNRVWSRVAERYPAFTRQYDSFGNPWAVEGLVLDDFVGFEPYRGAKVMDLGANVGIWTAFCAVAGCSVTAYEADRTTYGFLKNMLERTGLEASVSAINKAVWTYTGKCVFRGDEGSQPEVRLRNGAIQVKGKNVLEGLETEDVECTSLEQAIGAQEWDCVKVDIEGAEFETLRVTPIEVFKQIKFMQVEFHNAWADKQEHFALIEKMEHVFEIKGSKNLEGEWEGRYHWAQFRRKKEIRGK